MLCAPVKTNVKFVGQILVQKIVIISGVYTFLSRSYLPSFQGYKFQDVPNCRTRHL